MFLLILLCLQFSNIWLGSKANTRPIVRQYQKREGEPSLGGPCVQDSLDTRLYKDLSQPTDVKDRGVDDPWVESDLLSLCSTERDCETVSKASSLPLFSCSRRLRNAGITKVSKVVGTSQA